MQIVRKDGAMATQKNASVAALSTVNLGMNPMMGIGRIGSATGAEKAFNRG